MSQENVDLIRAAYEAAAEGRLGAFSRLLDPDVEYGRTSGGGDVLTGKWRGLDAMAAAVREYLETVQDLRVEAEQYIDVGNAVVVLTRHRGTARASGLPIDEEHADVLTLHDGRIVRFDVYRHRSEALKAVGLAE